MYYFEDKTFVSNITIKTMCNRFKHDIDCDVCTLISIIQSANWFKSNINHIRVKGYMKYSFSS